MDFFRRLMMNICLIQIFIIIESLIGEWAIAVASIYDNIVYLYYMLYIYILLFVV